MRIKGVIFNIIFSENWYVRGVRGFLNRLSIKSGFTKFMCKRRGYK